jgi:hypothetical protein
MYVPRCAVRCGEFRVIGASCELVPKPIREFLVLALDIFIHERAPRSGLTDLLPAAGPRRQRQLNVPETSSDSPPHFRRLVALVRLSEEVDLKRLLGRRWGPSPMHDVRADEATHKSDTASNLEPQAKVESAVRVAAAGGG